MSLQRVLETARKAGMPVIITDVAGREPMVVMPLEQFEAMAGEANETVGERAVRPPMESERADFGVLSRTTHVPTEMVTNDPVDQALAEMTAERLKNRMEEAVENTDFALEERFYLEPVDDQSSNS